jgi:hypothetical protein
MATLVTDDIRNTRKHPLTMRLSKAEAQVIANALGSMCVDQIRLYGTRTKKFRVALDICREINAVLDSMKGDK